MTSKLIYLSPALLYLFVYSSIMVHAQTIEEVRELGESLNQFSLKFLAKTAQETGNSINLALSPYTIWTLLNIIREGALENTAAELEKTLGISPNQNKDSFRKVYQALSNYLSKTGPGEVTLDTTNSIYTAADQKLKPDFLQVVQSFYTAQVTPIDFRDTGNAVNFINKQISNATRGRITNFVKEDDLRDAEIFLTSVLFFKGTWINQFSKSATAKEPFYGENGNQIGEVDMMYDFGSYGFTFILDNKALAVELPYKGNMSLIAVLPNNVPLQSVLDMLAKTPFSNVIDALEKSFIDFGDDPVQILLPKFSIISDLTLNVILNQMGIQDLFNQENANLLGMVNNYLYVSRVLQRAEIQVNEEGTVASAAAGGSLQNKSTPGRFLANKPFAYFICDKASGGIIFAGKISNPQTLS